VEGFYTTDAFGRKSYKKGAIIKWDVEIGSFTLEMLMTSLCNEVKWASNQSTCVWFFDKNMREDVRLLHEGQMAELFAMYKQEMCCQFIVGVFDKEVCNEHEFDDLEALCVIPPDDPMISHHVSNENPTAANQSTAPNGAVPSP